MVSARGSSLEDEGDYSGAFVDEEQIALFEATEHLLV